MRSTMNGKGVEWYATRAGGKVDSPNRGWESLLKEGCGHTG
jgi:hypothetical protein